ncbi:MAG: TetR/AcrR family transcriptional regulator [Pseudomonadota bacterium]
MPPNSRQPPEAPISTSPAGPKPRKRKDKETRVAEIVEAAFEVFTRDGLSAAKIDDVAERAEVSKGTIYTYFETKEALFEAVVRNYILAALEEAFSKGLAQELSHEERLCQMIKAAYSLFGGTEIRRIMILLVGEGGRFPELLKLYHDIILNRAREVIGQIIGEGIEAGVFRDVPARDFPQIVMGPGMMGAIWAQHFGDLSPLNLDELYDAHIDLLLNGLRTREVPSS